MALRHSVLASAWLLVAFLGCGPPTKHPTLHESTGGKVDSPTQAPFVCRFAELHRGEELVGWESELLGPIDGSELTPSEVAQALEVVREATGSSPASVDEALDAVDARELMVVRLRYVSTDRRYVAFWFLVDDVMQFVYFRQDEAQPIARVVNDQIVACDEGI